MIHAFIRKVFRKKIAWMMTIILGFETLYPMWSLALTSGPVQPEAQAFEPVGTTDMVDPFTGDFIYNIPLMDVEGYPINISYHGGVGMDQEASWVGLGWNINPGAINRVVRGLPDEFSGEVLDKTFSVKPDKTTKIGLTGGAEIVGMGEPYLKVGANAELGAFLTLNNYRGVSLDFTTTVGVNASIGVGSARVSGGLNVGASVGSQTGAAIDYSANWGAGITARVNNDISAGASFNMNTGGNYSPRTGARSYSGQSIGLSMSERRTGASTSFSAGTYVPVGMISHTASLSNKSYSNSYAGQLKLGFEVYSVYPEAKIFGSFSKTSFEPNGSRPSYGYLNLHKASPAGTDILDFSREKDGTFNHTMALLPQTHLTYDVYSVCGQGTGGAFRPHRNDIGSVYDPIMTSSRKADEVNIEAGIGNLVEIGAEFKATNTEMTSGFWDEYHRPFKTPSVKDAYEEVYFKEAGELTVNNDAYVNGIGNKQVITAGEMNGISLLKPGSSQRVTRANHIYTINGDNSDTALLLDSKRITSYESDGFKSYPNITKTSLPRVDTSGEQFKRRASHITEIVQLQKDGRRYVYGLPVMNYVQREAIFAIQNSQIDRGRYLANYTDNDDKPGNGNGTDNFYSATVTPSYVSAHLLTGVLSADYSDVTGDGITDDDLGTYTRFNYSRKSKDYRWRSPIDSGKAQYIPGYVSDTRDDKAMYLIGSREQWMLHSVETKNYVAEFYVSKRKDAKGLQNKILAHGQVYNDARFMDTGRLADQYSYKLDSIVLYNKHDRFVNGQNAQAIKAVIFSYDYSLCQGAPNSEQGFGKLTLKKIQMKYGTSNLNLSAGYLFNYDAFNPGYSNVNKDRWGTYKPNDSTFNNYEFPFTAQLKQTDTGARAWSLTEIGLPSGGIIKVDYESDDYAYVQNQLAMEMFKVTGFGSSQNYDDGTQLYHSADQPNLFLYFNRRTSSENPLLSFEENYLKGTDVLYYNVPVRLAEDKYEPIKGYAKVAAIGICPNDNQKGYIQLEAQRMEQTDLSTNPIAYTAMNVGRYNLSHIFFPGSDPDNSDIENIVTGLKSSFGELFNITKNPLQYYMEKSLAKETDLHKSFIRLTSPGLRKKGGGQRVSKIRFFDNWSKMTAGAGNDATYGKEYSYLIAREDRKGYISSGVASWEPIAGGDELPQRMPLKFTAQASSKFPPNDPIDLYQELPIGESFFPAPVVGYSKVTVRSINKDIGRSSQTEDVHYFYTAKDFPIHTAFNTLETGDNNSFKLQNTKVERWATQGFSIVLNDMHGKPLNTEHWVLKPDTGSKARELVSYQRNEYLTSGGQLSNDVPVFDYAPNQGKLSVATHKMGLETDITVDTRHRHEETKTWDFSGNINGFIVGVVPIFIPLGFLWPFESSTGFNSATVTKVVQQYGVLNKVVSYNQGAITELKNEVFDAQTGNALVTSVNNEFKDRQYTVNYPAHWAYKEMGPSYENQNIQSTFPAPLIIDTFGFYAARFINYNPAYSYAYTLPSNMTVGRTIVDNDMPKYKLGDQLLLQLGTGQNPVRTWVMGYTSDTSHCYVVLATREPYQASGLWSRGQTIGNVGYRVIQSGNKNRLGETIQSFTTTDAANIFPSLKDSLRNLISFSASRFNHNLSQVFAANLISDSLNPFVTGKVGIYRNEMEITNLKKRDYNGGTTRKMGTFSSAVYWKTETDNFAGYCLDSSNGDCDHLFDTLKVTNITNDTVKIEIKLHAFQYCDSQRIRLRNNIYGFGLDQSYAFASHSPIVMKVPGDPSSPFHYFNYSNGCCNASFVMDGLYTFPQVYITRLDPGSGSTQYTVYHETSPASSGTITKSPYRIRKKIFLGKVGRYEGTDAENWVRTQQTTKYNWYGAELENKEEGIGFNAAMYGYNQQLPVCVAKNARHEQVLFDGFEDYAMLQAKPSMRQQYMKLIYSPFAAYLGGAVGVGSLYQLSTLVGTGSIGFSVSSTEAHSGNYSLKTETNVSMPLNATGAGVAKGYTFRMADSNKKYVASIWLRPSGSIANYMDDEYGPTVTIAMDTVLSGGPTSALITQTLQPKSNIIDGWQQFEASFTVPMKYKNFKLNLTGGYYYDDIRIYPFESNSKGFVYHPVTRKLMATLDENNYATFYEYDAEGNLIRTKKETEQGIMTISETRSTHAKIQQP